MNPYEKYYLRQKILAGAIGVGVIAAAVGIGLAWEPWKNNEQEDLPEPPSVEDQVQQPEEEKADLTITVGGNKVDCRLYEGDGWSIPVPMDWTVEEGKDAVKFLPPDSKDSMLSVEVSNNAAYNGTFISANAVEIGEEDGFERLFYSGTTGRGFDVACRMTEDGMDDYEKTMTAMARTMTIGNDRPFASLYPMASQPEWQVIDNEVVLFLDKDGIDVDSIARTATEDRMNAWSNDTKQNFTGKYRLGAPEWVSSYTCVVEDYVDVFMVPVEFQVASGKASSIPLSEGQMVRNGWLSDANTVLYVAVFHDGSAVNNTITAWKEPGYRGAEFVKSVIARK
ncbi:MAG: hypothetical protein IJ955_10925 [Oscillospiraceae bacterium]|nr:hypothetical protein [Oscillospiraceae bacterium]